MWLLTLLCGIISAASVCASAGDHPLLLRKCCPRSESLIKLDNSLGYDDNFECVNSESAFNYNLTDFSVLQIADSVNIDAGIPENCDLQMDYMTKLDTELSTAPEVCYDRLALDITNSTSVKYIPKTVVVRCMPNENVNNISTKLKITSIRKCCPKGLSYDTELHLCRDANDKNTSKWLSKLFSISHNNYIYGFEYGLRCKNYEYSVELSERKFTLNIDGNTLKYSNNNDAMKVADGDWCVDSDVDNQHLVARVCTQDCSKYSAFCLRKCCPLGQHFKQARCGSFRSVCVPDMNDTVYFNMSSYIDPIKKDNNDDTFDVIGLRIGLKCSAGRFVLNRSSENDEHYMLRNGHYGQLKSPNSVYSEYCIETFDKRECDNDMAVTAVSCFLEPQAKNFLVAAVTNSISAVCMMVTLLVYCALPELRNLHGRTIICHVSMMLLAYACLARVQYQKVLDNNLCIVLGYGIYFGFVAAFVWLNVMCLDIWWTFGSIRTVQPLRKAGAERRRFIWYSLYAWGMTISLTLTMFLLDKYPVADFLQAKIGSNMCWFGSIQNSKSDWPHYIFFVIPMGLMTCVNLGLWLVTARHCARVKSEVHRLQAGSVGDRAKRRFRIDQANYVLTGKLWVVMGAGWFSELLSTVIVEPEWFWMIIDIINQLQGLFIFLILVFKPKIYYLIRKRLGLEKPDAQKNGATSSGRTSSTFLSRTISTDERTQHRVSLPNNGIKRA